MNYSTSVQCPAGPAGRETLDQHHAAIRRPSIGAVPKGPFAQVEKDSIGITYSASMRRCVRCTAGPFAQVDRD